MRATPDLDYARAFPANLPRRSRGPGVAPGPEEVGGPLRPYEVMVILDSTLEDEAIRVAVERITAAFVAPGASVQRVEHWGRRRFAYELRHRSEGYYVVISALAEPASMADVDRMLSLADEVIRHKVIRVPDAVAARAPAPASAPAGDGEAAVATSTKES